MHPLVAVGVLKATLLTNDGQTCDTKGMNDDRHDARRPRGPSSPKPDGYRQAHSGTQKKPGSSQHPPKTPGARPKYVAPPRVVYTQAKMLGIAEHSTPVAPNDAARLVSTLLDIIEEASPLPTGRHKDLRRDVLELWRELTSEKSTRQPDYIGEPAKLAAYLRYFLPWNIVRLTPLLADMDLGLKPGDGVIDIGSGPLTLPIALWISRPDLRAMELRIDCVDRVRRVMEIGATILEGLALRTGQPLAWKIGLKKESYSFTDDSERERYALVSAANVFNESFWRIKGSLSERADMLASSLGAHVAPAGRILIVEPGDPRSGAMLAAIRESVIRRGGRPLAPCPHAAACPMAGAFLSSAFRKDDEQDNYQSTGLAMEKVITARGRSKAPWCHFVLDSSAAPPRLIAFSDASGLPKDRLIASYLLLQPEPPADEARAAPGDRTVRIVSDAFKLPDGGLGRYACSRTGYTLARDSLADLPSGSLAILDATLPSSGSQRDEKSNAVILKAYSDAIKPLPLAPKAPRYNDSASGSHGSKTESSSKGSKPGDSKAKQRKPPILPRRGDATHGKKGLAERSPYARSKKPWGPKRPKRPSS